VARGKIPGGLREDRPHPGLPAGRGGPTAQADRGAEGANFDETVELHIGSASTCATPRSSCADARAAEGHRQRRHDRRLRRGRRRPPGHRGWRRLRRLRRPGRASRGRLDRLRRGDRAPSQMAEGRQARARPGPSGQDAEPEGRQVTDDIAKAVEEAKAGKVEYRTDRQAIVHLTIGKASFSEQDLLENLRSVIEDLIRAKPAAAKGRYILSITLHPDDGTGQSASIPLTHPPAARSCSAPERVRTRGRRSREIRIRPPRTSRRRNPRPPNIPRPKIAAQDRRRDEVQKSGAGCESHRSSDRPLWPACARVFLLAERRDQRKWTESKRQTVGAELATELKDATAAIFAVGLPRIAVPQARPSCAPGFAMPTPRFRVRQEPPHPSRRGRGRDRQPQGLSERPHALAHGQRATPPWPPRRSTAWGPNGSCSTTRAV